MSDLAGDTTGAPLSDTVVVDRLRAAAIALTGTVEAAEADSRRAAAQLAALLEQAEDERKAAAVPSSVSVDRLAAAVGALHSRAESLLSRARHAHAAAEATAEVSSLEAAALEAETDVFRFADRVTELERIAGEHLEAALGSLGAVRALVEELRATLGASQQAFTTELDALQFGVREQVQCFFDVSAARAAELEARVADLVGAISSADVPSANDDGLSRVDALRDTLRELRAFAVEEGRPLERLVEELTGTMRDLARQQNAVIRIMKVD